MRWINFFPSLDLDLDFDLDLGGEADLYSFCGGEPRIPVDLERDLSGLALTPSLVSGLLLLYLPSTTK